MWPRVRRAAGAIIIGVPAVALGASAWYREQHRPKLPPHHLRDLNGATVVMTGATSGIGKAVASRLVSQGATVVIGCRDESRGEASRQEILSGAGISAEQVEVLPLDLANIGSVKAFARECQARHPRSISTLISVAAEIVYEHPRLTASGADLGFATNHLGLQALVSELEPSLVQASPAGSERKRVVIVGSRLEARGVVEPDVVQQTRGAQLSADFASRDPMRRYADTKRCNALLATVLAARWRGQPIDVLSVTPGMVHTGLWRNFPQWYQALTYPIRAVALRSADDAALGVVYAAAALEVDGKSGAYLSDGVEVQPSQGALDTAVAGRLFEVCSEIIGRG